jgi:5-methylcytosine-specific restriction endonuclease McrA
MKSPIPEWSDAKFKGWIISLLRRGTMRWPPRNEVLKAAKTVKKVNPKSGRLAQHFECNGCKQDFPAKGVVVDHKKPVVDIKKGFIDFDTYINRMYCAAKNLQVLCKDCHTKKSKKEREARKKCSIKKK